VQARLSARFCCRGLANLASLSFSAYHSPNMSSSATHDPERRRYPRVKARIPVELTCIGAAPMRTSTDEISLCGCYITTMFTMDVGTSLGVTLSLDHEVIRCTGVVATKYPQVGNGIDFIDMPSDDRLKLSRYIAEQNK
jgi:c-di-GMP-binding flagellar brake protein YcgR